jgi:hypothetical protein
VSGSTSPERTAHPSEEERRGEIPEAFEVEWVVVVVVVVVVAGGDGGMWWVWVRVAAGHVPPRKPWQLHWPHSMPPFPSSILSHHELTMVFLKIEKEIMSHTFAISPLSNPILGSSPLHGIVDIRPILPHHPDGSIADHGRSA